MEARGPVGSFRRSLREEASARWGVAPTLAEALFVLPFVGAVLVVASRADKSLFRAIVDEDRLLEWLQFVGFSAFAFLQWLRLSEWRRVTSVQDPTPKTRITP